jgi:hypothetical protein
MTTTNRQTAAARATAEAIQRLKDAHPDEWETYYREERIKRGLSADVGISAVRQENTHLRAKLQELERQLAEQR